MPAAGRKPNEGKPVRHRVKPVHEWTEVEGVAFGGGPKLPARTPDDQTWPARTKAWWEVIRRMPHCVLWDASDWEFALDTALVAAKFHAGDIKVATELRNREKVLGTTVDFRRDLRIRYVEPKAEVPAGITALDEYRKMVEE